MTQVNCRRDDLQRYAGLQWCRVMIGEITQQRALLVAPVPEMAGEAVTEWLPAVQNTLGRLLLPLVTPDNYVTLIELHRDKPAFILYDECGRVHLVVVDECLFFVLMRLWEEPALQTSTLDIASVSHEEHRLYSADPTMTLPLTLPPETPPEFQQWQALGTYDVTFDARGRVFSVHSPTTSIILGPLWETRL